MEADPFYKICCISGRTSEQEKIDWHHNLIFAGRQVNEAFCILPLAKSIHDRIVEYKELCDYIMLSRATPEERSRYSKAINYELMYQNLKKKYEI